MKLSGKWPPRVGTIAAGAVGIVLFPAPNLGVLAWVAFVPLLLLIRAAPTRREAMLRGWLGGFGFVCATEYWLLPNLIYFYPLAAAAVALLWLPWGLLTWAALRPGPLVAQMGAPRVVTVGAAAAVGEGGEAGRARSESTSSGAGSGSVSGMDSEPRFEPSSEAARSAAQPNGPQDRFGWGRSLLALIAVPAGWVLVETIRSWKPFGGPWSMLGASQWDHPVELGLASVGGVWLLTFAIVMVNTCIVLLATAQVPVKAASAVLGALAIIAGPIWVAMHPLPTASRDYSVALVQPGVIHDPQARDEEGIAITKALLGKHVDLVLWGESSGNDGLATDAPDQQQLTSLSATLDAPILVDADAVLADGDTQKVSYLYTASGMQGQYAKTRLVMFGEYIPFRGELHWLTSMTKAAGTNLVAGYGLTVFRSGGASLGPLICFESAFPDMGRTEANAGAQILVYQSEDSTFQGSWEPAQHASLAAVRAAETGRPAVQASLAGVSAAFDAQGREIAWLSKDDVGSLVATVPMQKTNTPYDRYGNYVPIVSAVLVAFSLVAMIRLKLFSNMIATWPIRRKTSSFAGQSHET